MKRTAGVRQHPDSPNHPPTWLEVRRMADAQDIPTTRADARRSGSLVYFTGKPCPQGHTGLRYTSKSSCVECTRESVARLGKVGYHQAWAKKNPKRRSAIANAYKGRRRAAEKDGVSGPQLREWAAKQRKTCYWCGVDCADQFETDHYIPLAKGGKHELGNLVISCPPCNRTKNSKLPEQFAQERGVLI